MRVLVSTKRTQGFRGNDFCRCEEGEILRGKVVCESDRDNPDGPHGCNRSLTGYLSDTSTTTMEVADRAVTVEDIVQEMMVAVRGRLTMNRLEKRAVRMGLAKMMREFCREASRHPVGTVLEFRAGKFAVRAGPPEMAS